MQPIRQGDVILLPVKNIAGKKLSHLTLAKGEVTGHAHRISNGQAQLYEHDGTLYLHVLSKTATLYHEEHHALPIPQGNWIVRIQREYVPQKRKSAVPPRKSNKKLGDNLSNQAEKNQLPSSSRLPLPKQRDAAFPKKSNEPEAWDDLMGQIQALSERDLMEQIQERSELLPQQSTTSVRQVTPEQKISPIQKFFERYSRPAEPTKAKKVEPKNWRHVVD